MSDIDNEVCSDQDSMPACFALCSHGSLAYLNGSLASLKDSLASLVSSPLPRIVIYDRTPGVLPDHVLPDTLYLAVHIQRLA